MMKPSLIEAAGRTFLVHHRPNCSRMVTATAAVPHPVPDKGVKPDAEFLLSESDPQQEPAPSSALSHSVPACLIILLLFMAMLAQLSTTQSDGRILPYVVSIIVSFSLFESLRWRARRHYDVVMPSRAERATSLVVSTVFAMIAFSSAVIILSVDSEIHVDHRSGVSPSSVMISAFAAGYFIHDIMDCLQQSVLVHTLLFHHILCSLIYLYALFAKRWHYFAVVCLMFEGKQCNDSNNFLLC